MFKIEFQGHKGVQNMKDDSVTFYSSTFKNILVAVQVLKDFNPGNYKFIICQNQLALYNLKNDSILMNDEWKVFKNF